MAKKRFLDFSILAAAGFDAVGWIGSMSNKRGLCVCQILRKKRVENFINDLDGYFGDMDNYYVVDEHSFVKLFC